MKYRVVGWADYSDPDIEEGDVSESALQAIVEDIRKNGYCFSGWDHQESFGCAPVLNDGKRRTFSQRGFGAVMAMAHGDLSRMGYAGYAFDFAESDEKSLPPRERAFDPEKFTPETDLCEVITVKVSDEYIKEAETARKVRLADSEGIKLVDIGDTLKLVADNTERTFLIKGVERCRDLDEETELKIRMLAYEDDNAVIRKYEQIYETAPWIVRLVLD